MAVDPNIKKKADDIRTKIKGKEVRESLASGIEDISEDVVQNEGRQSNVEQRQSSVEDRQTDVENRFDDQIAGNTDIDEVIDARHPEGGEAYPTLRKRLDEEHQEVTAQLAQTAKVVQVESFREEGDTDGDVLRKAHAHANTNGMDVEYPHNKVYNLDDVSELEIKTSVNFNNSKLMIDDSYHRTKEVFRVVEDVEPTNVSPLVLNNLINRKTKVIPELAGYGKAFVVIKNANKQQHIRYNYQNQSHDQTDFFVIDNDGVLLHEVTYDFDEITSIEVQPISDKFITIENVNPVNSGDTLGDTRILRGFKIMRSNVIIDNLVHEVQENLSEANPSEGILFINKAHNVKIINTKLTPRKHHGQGNYEIRTDMVTDLLLKRVEGYSNSPDYWGVIGGNRMKDLLVVDSKLNRIDSHVSSHNITIDNCKIGNYGLSLVGFGDLIVRQTEIHSNELLTLRSDYGGSWNGNIYFDGIKHFPSSNSPLFRWSSYLDHDFGYDTHFGDGVVSIKDYECFNEGLSGDLFLFYITPNNYNEKIRDYYYADKFEFMNMKTHGNKFRVFRNGGNNYSGVRSKNNFSYDITNEHKINIKPNIIFNFDNVEFERNANIFEFSTSFGMNGEDEDFLLIKNRLVPEFNFKNCDEIFLNVRALPSLINIEKSIVRQIYNIVSGVSRSVVDINKSIMEPIMNVESNTTFFLGQPPNFKVRDSDFRVPIDNNNIERPSFITEVTYGCLLPIVNPDYIVVRGIFENVSIDNRIDLNSFVDFVHNYHFDFQNSGNAPVDKIWWRVRGPLAARPDNDMAFIGQAFYNTDDHKLEMFTGSDWA